MNPKPLPFRIHTLVAQTLGNSSKLFYVLRAMDESGKGLILTTIDELKTYLNCSTATIYRYLKDNRFIRNVSSKKGVLTIYLNSLKVVAYKCGLSDIGAVGWLTTDDLKELKTNIALVEALRLQKASQKAALNKKNDSQNIVDVDKLFKVKADFEEIVASCSNSLLKPESSYIGKGALLKNNLLYINCEDYAPMGGSQETIAKRLNINSKTVNRRLKSVNKVRQAIGSPENSFKKEYHEFLDEENWTSNANKYFTFTKHNMPGITCFQSYTNLYEECISLCSMKQVRKSISLFSTRVNTLCTVLCKALLIGLYTKGWGSQ